MTRYRRLFWTLAVLCFLILSPLFGTLGFLIGFSVGMASFGPPQHPSGWSFERLLNDGLIYLSNVPVPVDWLLDMKWLTGGPWLYLRIANMVICAGLLSWLIAYLTARRFHPRPMTGQGFPLNLPGTSPDPSAPLPLDYASIPRAPVRRPWLGAVAAAISLLSAGGIVSYVIRLSLSSVAARNSYCGTGQLTASTTQLFEVPFLLLIPLAAWVLSRHARSAQPWARCGLWASLIGWVACARFVLSY